MYRFAHEEYDNLVKLDDLRGDDCVQVIHIPTGNLISSQTWRWDEVIQFVKTGGVIQKYNQQARHK